MKRYFIFIAYLLTYSDCFAQIKPIDKGFTAYKIETVSDTVEFFMYNPQHLKKKHLFVHVSGSWPSPLWVETKPCCVTSDPFTYDLIPKHVAYVVISKYGFPFSTVENFQLPTGYWEKNTLEFRVNRTNLVLNYIKEHIFKPEKVVLVGTSQGTDVVAKLATLNNDITHIGFWAGGGLSQLMEFIMFERKKAISGKISEVEATARIDSLLKQFELMFANPSPNQKWDSNSYKSYVSFSEPPVQNLLKLDIPIFVAVGTRDENIAIENAYIIPVEFIRHRKQNLTFRHYPNYDHNFVELLDNGKNVDRFDSVTSDFFKWLKNN